MAPGLVTSGATGPGVIRVLGAGGGVSPAQVVDEAGGADEAEAAHLMLRHRVKSLPVVDGDRLLGVISVTDILRVKVQGDARIAAGVHQRLLAYAGDEGCWDVAVEDGVVTISSPLPYEKHPVLLALAETVPGVVRVRVEAWGCFRGAQRSAQGHAYGCEGGVADAGDQE